MVQKLSDATLTAFLRAANEPGSNVNEQTVRALIAGFKQNKHGHVFFRSFCSQSRTGAEEIERAKQEGLYRLDARAEEVLLCAGEKSYDAKHRLTPGKESTYVLLPGGHILQDGARSTESLLGAAEGLGYRASRAGSIFAVRRIVSDEQMKSWGFGQIVVLDPVLAPNGKKFFLSANCCDVRNSIVACPESSRLFANDAFLFELS